MVSVRFDRFVFRGVANRGYSSNGHDKLALLSLCTFDPVQMILAASFILVSFPLLTSDPASHNDKSRDSYGI